MEREGSPQISLDGGTEDKVEYFIVISIFLSV